MERKNAPSFEEIDTFELDQQDVVVDLYVVSDAGKGHERDVSPTSKIIAAAMSLNGIRSYEEMGEICMIQPKRLREIAIGGKRATKEEAKKIASALLMPPELFEEYLHAKSSEEAERKAEELLAIIKSKLS